jgi:hypothetical protein
MTPAQLTLDLAAYPAALRALYEFGPQRDYELQDLIGTAVLLRGAPAGFTAQHRMRTLLDELVQCQSIRRVRDKWAVVLAAERKLKGFPVPPDSFMHQPVPKFPKKPRSKA